ncbi:MAG: hypothetical protein K0T53_00035 [Wolbachia pipientis]|nr:hypothetical protein [Wolbachia pipientis]
MLKSLTKLLKHGNNYNNLKLSTEKLQALREKQKTYYNNLLEKLTKPVKQFKLEKKTNIEKKIKDAITNSINILNIDNNNYLLYSVINNDDKKLFKKPLQKGLNISLKDVNDNNTLHLIISKLKKEHKLKFFNILLKVSKEKQCINATNNNKNQESQIPLHQLLQNIQEKNKKFISINKIKNITKKEFKNTNKYKTLKTLLENSTDITTQDKKENNALHYIISFKGKQKIAYLKLILHKNEFSNAINALNKKGQTPLHQLLQYMQKKSEKLSLVSFEKTKRYKTLKLLLENGVDITVKDSSKKNALHYIASLKGKQKVACLDLIVKDVNIPEDKIIKAINAKNNKEQTPLQVALISRIVKDKYNSPNHKNNDNIAKFCVKLLQNGADPKQLILPESLWNRKYYQTLKEIEKLTGKSLIPDDTKTKLKLNFSKKFKTNNIMKHTNNIIYKTVTTFIFIALTCTIILSATRRNITITTTLYIIAAIVGCCLIYFNLENLYNSFKEIKIKFTKEKQIISEDNRFKNNMQYSNFSQSIENKPNNPEKQKTQKLQDQLQLKYIKKSLPNFKIDDISTSKFIEKILEPNKVN